jgi:hypothetical protein
MEIRLHRKADQATTRIMKQPIRPPKVQASRVVWGIFPNQENFGFFEAQISYFHHFEEFSNNKLTLH